MYTGASDNLSRAKMPIVPGTHLPSLALTSKKGKQVYSQAAPERHIKGLKIPPPHVLLMVHNSFPRRWPDEVGRITHQE